MTKNLSVEDGFLLPEDDQRGMSTGLAIPADYDAASKYQSLLMDRISQGLSQAIFMSDVLPGGTYRFGNGVVGVPSISFTNSTDTGEYLIADHNPGFCANGILIFQYDATKVQIESGKLLRLVGFSAGSVLFTDSDGDVTEDNTQLYWDDASNILSIGATREATSTSGIVKLFSATVPYITFRNTSDYEGFVGFGVANAAEMAAGTYTNHNFKLYSNNTLRISIAAGGAITHTAAAGAPVTLNSTNVDSDIYMGSSGGSYLFCLNAGTNTIGINCPGTTPRRRLDVLDTTAPQFRLTYTDDVVFTDIGTNSTGWLNLDPKSGIVNIRDYDTTRYRLTLYAVADGSGGQIVSYDDTGAAYIDLHFHAKATYHYALGVELMNVTSGGITINDGQGDYDFRVEGDSLAYMIYTDGSAATENLALLTTVAPNWQTMDRGAFLGNCSTAPTGDPVAGGFLYAEAGALKWRGSSGTVTVLAAA